MQKKITHHVQRMRLNREINQQGSLQVYMKPTYDENNFRYTSTRHFRTYNFCINCEFYVLI